MNYHVALLSPPYSTLTYENPSWFPENIWKEGLRVAVPLGAGAFRVGVILRAGVENPAGIRLRSMVWPMEREPMLDTEYMDMIRQLALRQMLAEGRILGTVLPQGLRTTKNIRIREFQENGKPRLYRLRELGQSPEILSSLAQSFIDGQAQILAVAEDAAMSEKLIITADPPWRIRASAIRQRAILDFLWQKGSVSRRMLSNALPGHNDALNSLIQAGIIRIQSFSEEEQDCALLPPPMPRLYPNAEQQAALDRLLPDMHSDKASAHLLFGITGSGKTAVYLELARQCLASGRSVLLLAPEVGIALKLRQDAQNQGMPVLLYHGYQSPRMREKHFREAYQLEHSEPESPVLENSVLTSSDSKQSEPEHSDKKSPKSEHSQQEYSASKESTPKESTQEESPPKESAKDEAKNTLSPAISDNAASPAPESSPAGNARLIIGTRSALFLPIRNIGLIILDEEHDDSFKQDEGLPYHAKDIAWYRARRSHALFVMGSATPDLKSFYAGKQGFYPVERLEHRASGGSLPEIELVDIKEFQQTLAPASIAALRQTVERGEQALIMLNRRGYAPLVYCLDCNTVARCPNCDISLSYHKRREQLTCHYCGYTRPFPSPCAQCKGMHFLPLGEGTERLEEDLAKLVPGTKVLRLDSDTTRREGRLEEILGAFARHEAQILVGTQMLSKGHHFPDVTLAIIADGDLGLNFPDYRAAERTFQLLIQAAGRAGRGEKKGKVIIQTRDTKHYCWDFVRKGNYEDFYAYEIALREKRRYPPFIKLALIRASWPRELASAPALWQQFTAHLKEQGRTLGMQVLGPSPAPISFLQGRLRFQCLIKSNDWTALRRLFAENITICQPNGKMPEGMRVDLDIDPVNML